MNQDVTPRQLFEIVMGVMGVRQYNEPEAFLVRQYVIYIVLLALEGNVGHGSIVTLMVHVVFVFSKRVVFLFDVRRRNLEFGEIATKLINSRHSLIVFVTDKDTKPGYVMEIRKEQTRPKINQELCSVTVPTVTYYTSLFNSQEQSENDDGPLPFPTQLCVT